tara:strand:- start:1717 stop:2304 length:588 start_codon:yes stop_codon:yes gene_type:complete
MLNIESFETKFSKIIESNPWRDLESAFKSATHIYFFGNGGNLAIADHAAIDVSRLTNKNAISPGSGITTTSIIGDTNAKSWIKTWLEYRARGIDPKKCLAIGFSCSTSGTSSEAIVHALEYAESQGMSSALITAQPKNNLGKSTIMISQGVSMYHTSEILSLALTYQLTHSAGFDCPSIFQKAEGREKNKKGLQQ